MLQRVGTRELVVQRQLDLGESLAGRGCRVDGSETASSEFESLSDKSNGDLIN